MSTFLILFLVLINISLKNGSGSSFQIMF
jgi:hypothetical protein